jgi:hypothetical protein
VTGRGQVPGDPAAATAGVQDPGAAVHHRVDQAGLPGQVVAVAGHGPETLDVPPGVSWFLGQQFEPAVLVRHQAILAVRRISPDRRVE